MVYPLPPPLLDQLKAFLKDNPDADQHVILLCKPGCPGCLEKNKKKCKKARIPLKPYTVEPDGYNDIQYNTLPVIPPGDEGDEILVVVLAERFLVPLLKERVVASMKWKRTINWKMTENVKERSYVYLSGIFYFYKDKKRIFETVFPRSLERSTRIGQDIVAQKRYDELTKRHCRAEAVR